MSAAGPSGNAPTSGNSGFMNFMNTNLGGAASGGIMDGIGSLFTIGAQKRSATTAYKRQKAFTKEVFDYTNAYNTPKAQMDRLRAAGLNPALMYGQGNVGNATAQTANVQKVDVSGPNLAQSVATGAQMSLLNEQRNLLKAQGEAAKLTATANFRNSLTNKAKYRLDAKIQPYQIDNLMSSTSGIKQEIKNKITEEALNQKKINYQQIENEILAIDKDFLKKNNISRQDYPMIKAIKTLVGNMGRAMSLFINMFSGERWLD